MFGQLFNLILGESGIFTDLVHCREPSVLEQLIHPFRVLLLLGPGSQVGWEETQRKGLKAGVFLIQKEEPKGVDSGWVQDRTVTIFRFLPNHPFPLI